MTENATLDTRATSAVLDAIRDRRSVGKVSLQIPPQEMIEQILEAGTWAPNHHLTEPWRFFVLIGEGRNRLGDALAEAAVELVDDPGARERIRANQAAKPLRAPVIIAIAVEPGPEDKTIELEEIAACAAAGQNMLLAAHALGLAAIWRSGKPTYSDQVRTFLNLSDRATVLGFIYIGYPSMEPPKRERRPTAAVTTWMT